MIGLDYLDQSNMTYSCEEYVFTMQKIDSVAYDNEYSRLKNNTDFGKCFDFVKHSEYAAKESTMEYLIDKRLLDNQVSKTRLENNLDNKYRIRNDQNKIRSKRNNEHMTGIIPGHRYHQTQRGDQDGKENNFKS